MDFFSAILESAFMHGVKQIKHWFIISYRPVVVVFSFSSILLAFCLFFEGRFSTFSFLGFSFSIFLKCSLFCVCICSFVALMEILKSFKRFEFDPLTGLKNMNEDVFPRLMQLNASCPRGISLALFDVDNFKQVNDTFGREIADQLLRNMAISLGDSCRQKQVTAARFSGMESSGFSKYREYPDELYRYYFRRGDEFLLVLVNSTLNDSIVKAIPRILGSYYNSQKDNEGLRIDSKPVPPLVLSCGVAQIGHRDTVEMVRKRLDEALREAKQKKNRICGRDLNGHLIVTERVFSEQ